MRVVIVGAGYAGAIAANRLARRVPKADIVMVNPRPDFVERIRLHQLIAGTGPATRPLRAMIDDRVALRIAAATEIGDGALSLSDGGELGFDALVYAAGGSVVAPEGAVAVGDVESARGAATQLAQLRPGALVEVVGGGLTGVETAAEVATARPDVRVRLTADDEIAESLGESARERVRTALQTMGVELRRGHWGAATADLTLWAVARQVSALAADSGLAVDGDGRVLVDSHLRSVTDRRVWAAGDGAAVAGARMSCQAAIPQGAYVADAIARESRGRTAAPFGMGFTAQCLSLGRRDGVVQRVHRDDEPARQWLGGRGLAGRSAALVKEQVCRSTVLAVRRSLSVSLPAPS